MAFGKKEEKKFEKPPWAKKPEPEPRPVACEKCGKQGVPLTPFFAGKTLLLCEECFALGEKHPRYVA